MTDQAPADASLKPLPLSVPFLHGNEWQYVKECLDGGWVSSAGAYVEEFERRVARFVGTKHAVATVNGTAALQTALLVAGIGPGDEVLVSTLTFIASANAIRYIGAHPVLIDAEERHWQMDPELVERFITERCAWSNGRLMNRQTGRPVRAILPVHVLGHPAAMAPILETAAKFNLTVIEDAAESLGARYRGTMVGGIGAIGCLSFNGNKTMTTGGGGMLLTNDDTLAERARYLTTQAKDDPIRYIHHEMGYNFRMPNVLAAIGCAQLEQLPGFLEKKRRIHAFYCDRLQHVPGLRMFEAAGDVECTYWLSTVRVDPATFGASQEDLRQELERQRIQSRPLWQPMHLSRVHRDCEAVITDVAERLAAECLSLPSSLELEEDDLQRVCDAIEALHKRCAGGRAAA